jgi:hypothetical protein
MGSNEVTRYARSVLEPKEPPFHHPGGTLILRHKFLNTLFLWILNNRLHVGNPLKISVSERVSVVLLGMHLVSKRLVYNDEGGTKEEINN